MPTNALKRRMHMPTEMITLDEDELAVVSGGAYTGSVFLYTARQGEDFRSLSRRFNTTVGILQELNPELSSISAGTRLLVPLNA